MTLLYKLPKTGFKNIFKENKAENTLCISNRENLIPRTGCTDVGRPKRAKGNNLVLKTLETAWKSRDLHCWGIRGRGLFPWSPQWRGEASWLEETPLTVLQQRRYLEGTPEKNVSVDTKTTGKDLNSQTADGRKEALWRIAGLMLTSVPHQPFIGRVQPETNWPGTLRNIGFHTLKHRKESKKVWIGAESNPQSKNIFKKSVQKNKIQKKKNWERKTVFQNEQAKELIVMKLFHKWLEVMIPCCLRTLNDVIFLCL